MNYYYYQAQKPNMIWFHLLKFAFPFEDLTLSFGELWYASFLPFLDILLTKLFISKLKNDWHINQNWKYLLAAALLRHA